MTSFKIIFIITGGAIGAGFISGAELVRFFHTEFYLLPVILSAALFAALCYVLLSFGKKYGGYDNVLHAVFHGYAAVVKIFIACCAFVPCAAMVAGLDAILPQIKPLLSICGLLTAALILTRGTRGISIANCFLVPVLTAFVFAYANFSCKLGVTDHASFGGGAIYAGMNSFLIAPVLLEAGKDAKSIVLPVVTSGILIAACALAILGAVYGCGEGALTAEMPFLYVMRGKSAFSFMVACAIFSSLASSLFPLLSLCKPLGGTKKYAAKIFILSAAFAFSRLGLGGIVKWLYPVEGGIGLCFTLFLVFYEYFFEKNHKKIHSRSKKAEYGRRAHHQVELEDLTAIHNQIPESRLRNDIFTHDRADPSHADSNLQHGDK